jgi:hypothetical protein
MVTEASSEPPPPEHVNSKTTVLVNAVIVSLPDVGLTPDQPPLPVHVLVFVEAQLRRVDPPYGTLVGSATRMLMNGSGCASSSPPPPPPHAAMSIPTASKTEALRLRPDARDARKRRGSA